MKQVPLRPWTIRPIEGDPQGRVVIVESCGLESFPFTRDCAELIVRCVNAEEAVVDALQAAQRYMLWGVDNSHQWAERARLDERLATALKAILP